MKSRRLHGVEGAGRPRRAVTVADFRADAEIVSRESLADATTTVFSCFLPLGQTAERACDCRCLSGSAAPLAKNPRPPGDGTNKKGNTYILSLFRTTYQLCF